METIKQTFLKYWFLASSIALAVLYFIVDRRGREINQLHADAQAKLISDQLIAINNKANISQEGFKNASKDYNDLLARHRVLMLKLGIFGQPNGQPPTSPNQPRNP